MTKDTQSSSSQTNQWRLFAGLCLFIILLVVAYYFAAPLTGLNRSELGETGDGYGALNTLFSGLAFAGVIFAIHLQRQELALQREELTLTRKELARAADSHESSARLLEEQVRLAREGRRVQDLDLAARYQPKLESGGYRNIEPGEDQFILRNYGHEISRLEVEPLANFEVSIQSGSGPLGEGDQVWVTLKGAPSDQGEFIFVLTYQDLLGKERSRILTYHLGEKWLTVSGPQSG